MSSSAYDGDFGHHDLIRKSDWDALRKLLDSGGSTERFASSNCCPSGVYPTEGMNAFHALCYDFDTPPLDIVARMVEIDEKNLVEKVKDPERKFAGATPLHLACEKRSSPWVKKLLTARPKVVMQLISEQDARGMTPLDVAWLSHIDADYQTYSEILDWFGQSRGQAIASLSNFSCPDEDYGYAKDIWEKTVHMLFAATAEINDAPTSWSVVQAIASTKVRCPNIAMWVALKVHPEQVSWKDRNGNFPLHMASACRNHYRYPIYPSGDERGSLVSIVDDWEEEEEEGKTREIIDEAQASPIRMLAEIYPEAASIPNNEGRYPVHLAAERGASWTDEVEHLFSAAPRTFDARDPKTMLLPFMLAAVDGKDDESADLVYKLLRANPANVEGGIRNTRYEQYLEEKVGKLKSDNTEKDKLIADRGNTIAEKDSIIADLRSRLKRKAHAMDPDM